MYKPESAKQHMMLTSNADIMVIGGAAGSGKSFVLNMIPMRYAHDPRWDGIIFRRTTVQVRGQGGMWDTAKEIYNKLPEGQRPFAREGDLTLKFKSGASLKYSHMEHVKNKLDHQGLQYSFIGFDEGTHFEWEQVEYLMSRMRSSAQGDSRMVISCNPEPDTWILPLIEWYLDEDGYPDPEKDGVIRYFVRKSGEFHWASTPEELMHLCKKKGQRPMSFTFISGNIYDNPIMMEENPAYLSFLEGLNDVDKARLLYGNWYARPQGDNYFQREWLQKAHELPSNVSCCRAWDKAATEPNDKNPTPDYTASVKMYKDTTGSFYLCGDWIPDTIDPDSKVNGRFRKRAGARDMLIEKQGLADGEDCVVILPQDPAAAGVTEFQESARKLIAVGLECRKDPTPSNKSKVTRFMPFSAACENGQVYILEHTFSNKSTLEAFLKELEAFNGEDSTGSRKDDWADCTASAFNYLSKKKVYPTFTLAENNYYTKIHAIKKHFRS